MLTQSGWKCISWGAFRRKQPLRKWRWHLHLLVYQFIWSQIMGLSLWVRGLQASVLWMGSNTSLQPHTTHPQMAWLNVVFRCSNEQWKKCRGGVFAVASVSVFGEVQGYSSGYDGVLSCSVNGLESSLCTWQYQTRSCGSSPGQTGCTEISPRQTCDRTLLWTKWCCLLSWLFLSNPGSLQQWCGETTHRACVCWNRDTCWCSQAPLWPVISQRWEHSSWSTTTPGCCYLTSRAALLTTAAAGSSRCRTATGLTRVSGVSVYRKSHPIGSGLQGASPSRDGSVPDSLTRTPTSSTGNKNSSTTKTSTKGCLRHNPERNRRPPKHLDIHCR